MPQQGIFQPLEEPMQVDASPEENENVKDGHTIVENTTLDLDSYAKQYEGIARLNRLIFIADHCPTLKVEALRMALVYVQTAHDTSLYQQIHRRLQETPSTLPDAVANLPPLDNQWIEMTIKKGQLKLEKLDTDLKNYKSNSIKESIRRGNDDLGDHYLDMGDLCNALKCYSRARDYCTSPKHVVNMCLNVIKVSVYLENWSHVISYVQKAESTTGRTEETDPVVQTKLKCAAGLADLATGKYKAAAKHFLQASFDNFNYAESTGRNTENLLSSSNVATYGSLCALASFDRQELQKNVISSSSFKLFLESDPQLRDILHMFYQSKYDSCLTLLEKIKNNLLLDMYLAPHVNALYIQIRNRALCQYFSPYLSADMHKMAEAFNTNVKDLEDELMQLILEGQINARIDSHNKILYAKDIDQRSSTFEKSIAMGQEYERRTKALILRSAMLKYQVQVKSKASSGMSETKRKSPPPTDGTQGAEMTISPGNSTSTDSEAHRKDDKSHLSHLGQAIILSTSTPGIGSGSACNGGGGSGSSSSSGGGGAGAAGAASGAGGSGSGGSHRDRNNPAAYHRDHGNPENVMSS